MENLACPRFAVRRRMFFGSILCLGLFFVGLMHVSAAETISRRSYNMPAGSAAETLKQFSEQSGRGVVANGDVVKGVTTNAVKGEYTPAEALNVMLNGTGLVAIPDSKSGAFAVRRETKAESKNASRANADTSARPEKSDARYGTDAGEEQVLKLDTFEVFGRKTLNMDVRRDRDDAQPYVVLRSEDIEKQGGFNLEEFLRARLPMNNQVGSNAQLPGAGAGNSSGINLRGLGQNQTLILVDGRRLPSIGFGSSLGQPDINGISPSRIERIEILPATAGGIYGGGATGGVINIVTRRDYAGVELRATYGNTFDNDASTLRVDLSAGLTLADGRTNVLFNASHTSATPLMVGERDFGPQARQLLLRNNRAAFETLATPPVGYTPNIRSVNGSNLVLTNGTALNSPRTFVPIGYGGITSDGGAALVANAGNYTLALGQDFSNAKRSLIWTPEVDSYTFNVRQQFSAAVEAYVDLSYMKNESTAMGGQVSASSTLPVGAPNNPFTTSIRVSYPVIHREFPLTSTTKAQGAIVGAIVKLPGDWMTVAEANRSKSTYSSKSFSPELSSAGISALNNGTLDVVRDVNRFPIDYSPYLSASPGGQGPMDVDLNQVSLRASGPIAEIRGKTLTMNSSVERRKETSDEAFSQFMFGGTNYITLYPARSQQVDAAFVEGRLPVVSQADGIPLVRALELTTSVRYETYTTRAPAPTSASLATFDQARPTFTYPQNEIEKASYTVALRYDVIEGIALRASIGTGFLPPSISQLVKSFSPSFSGFGLDPKRERIRTFWSTPLALTQGGNPSLKPEQSTSVSAGVVLEPSGIRGLRLSVDYTRIEKEDEIRGLTLQQALDFEDFLPGRVVRAPLTPADIALGYTGGAITAMDITLGNVAKTFVEAYDFQIDYAPGLSRGRVNFYAIATLQNHSTRQFLPGVPEVDSAGYSGDIRWRGNVGFDYEISNWAFGWNTQYYDSYFSYAAGSSAAVIASAVLNQGSDKIPEQWYHDVYGKYRFSRGPKRLIQGLEIGVSIQNVLNDYPPILASTAGNLGYSQYGDPRLRRYTLSIRKIF